MIGPFGEFCRLVTSQSAIGLLSARSTVYWPVGFCVITYHPGKYNVETCVVCAFISFHASEALNMPRNLSLL